MASSDLRKELDCSICLSVYEDPVTLRCGHSFCQGCVDPLLDTQEESGCYSCPECRETFPERPELNTNVTLNNILRTFRSSQKKTSCTYCILAPVPAVKSCLHCQASLCDDHLSVHSTAPEHVLSDPSDHQETRNCSVHKKILEYYCSEDAPCLCSSGHLREEHWGDLEDMVAEASKEKKKVLRKMMKENKDIEKKLRNLQERKRELEEKAESETERVETLLGDIKRRLEDLEKSLVKETSRQEERASLCDQIRELEIKKAELSGKMGPVQKMLDATDPLTLSQEPNNDYLFDSSEEEDEEEEEDDTYNVGSDLDVTSTSQALRTILDIISGVNLCFFKQEKTKVKLDEDTAENSLEISKNSAYKRNSKQDRLETAERFQGVPQVLSLRRFFSGQSYWDIKVGYSTDEWGFGVCYPSADRKGNQARMGNNDKSWALYMWNGQLSVIHDRKALLIPYENITRNIRVYLDYEGGRISFYDLCDPIRHIHTISATFTEPLRAVLGVFSKSGSLDV